MGGETVYKALDEFSRQKCAFYLLMRNIEGSAPDFSECFIDEGDLDVVRILRILKTNGFDRFLIGDHVPQMTADTPRGHRGRAFSTGYLRGLYRGIEEAKRAMAG